MKAIIPVAGAGTKLRPHTYTQPKALIPIAGKTILSFIVDQLSDAGIKEFVFIIGYLGEKIQEYVQNTYPDLKAYFVYQNDRQGTGHAVGLAQEFIKNDEIIITLGDTICEYDVKEVIESPYSMLGVKKVDNPRNFGVAEIDEDGWICHVVEKPHIPKSNMALVGVYKIRESALLFDALHQLLVKFKDEKQQEFSLTDAIDEMIRGNHNVQFKSFRVRHWFDCGKKDTLLQTNATLLKKFGGNVTSKDYPGSIIIPPVTVAANSVIQNSIIGPHVSIGPDSVIRDSVIRESIVGAYASLYRIVLDNSLIGSDASVKGLSKSLNIGDNTEIDFG